jgi:hypothetical protein
VLKKKKKFMSSSSFSIVRKNLFSFSVSTLLSIFFWWSILQSVPMTKALLLGKLYFRHGPVSSAKTMNLLAVAYNYRTQGKSVALLKVWV